MVEEANHRVIVIGVDNMKDRYESINSDFEGG